MGKIETIITVVVFNLFFIAFVIAILVFISQYRKRKKEHLDSLETQRREHQQELLSAQLEMQYQTMQHIGREIHDNVGQKLTLASLYTQQLNYENKVPQVHERIEQIAALLNQSLFDLRALSKSLTDNSIETQTLVQLVSSELQKIKALKVCKVQWKPPTTLAPLSYHTKSIVFRIIQEFLQNSIKHAQCTVLKVTVQQREQMLCIELHDDGIGFDTTKIGKGIGLQNMQKRAELLKATFHITSSSQGTHVQLTIPIINEI